MTKETSPLEPLRVPSESVRMPSEIHRAIFQAYWPSVSESIQSVLPTRSGAEERMGDAARRGVAGIDWARAGEEASAELRASRIGALRDMKWKAYVVSLLVYDAGRVVVFSTRLFHGVPTSGGLKRAFEGIARVREGEFVVAEGALGVSAALMRGGFVDSEVIVVVKHQEILGEDGL